jgi:hypothetical protein
VPVVLGRLPGLRVARTGGPPWTIPDRHAPVAAASCVKRGVDERFSPIGAVWLTAPRFACAQDVPSIAYESVPDLLRLPADLYLGEVSGVALNSAGHIFFLHRGNSTGPAYAAAAAQLLEFDRNGNYLHEIGHNLYAWSFAHTVKVDREDNVRVTDKGSDMVIKLTPQGRVDMVFGRKPEASDEDTAPLKHPNPPLPARDGYFRQVTDVAWGRRG